MREIITLQCSDCRQKNYTSTRNKKLNTKKVELKKFCKFCRKYTQHKEMK